MCLPFFLVPSYLYVFICTLLGNNALKFLTKSSLLYCNKCVYYWQNATVAYCKYLLKILSMSIEKIKKELFQQTDFLVRELAKITGIDPVLNPGEEAILSLLGEREGLSVKDVRQTLRMDAYKVSRILDSLEKFYKGGKEAPLVKRTLDPKDRRQVRISITPQGRKVLEENSARRAERLEILFAPLNDKELSTLAAIVDKLVLGLKRPV